MAVHLFRGHAAVHSIQIPTYTRKLGADGLHIWQGRSFLDAQQYSTAIATVTPRAQDEQNTRLESKLKRELGEIVLSLLADERTERIVLNPGSTLWAKRMGEGFLCVGEMPPAQAASALLEYEDAGRPRGRVAAISVEQGVGLAANRWAAPPVHLVSSSVTDGLSAYAGAHLRSLRAFFVAGVRRPAPRGKNRPAESHARLLEPRNLL
jgi:hypothetical protein